MIEDVIDTLTVKNITDLPAGAQAKLFECKSFRERTTRNSLHLFGDPDFKQVLDDTGFATL